ncbi:conserved hypothetical protein [Gloeothece citriformis PCC 7424]|uniref:Acetyltransferase n=1 Tax=Gloeothece citriformis (strain PCC 7424) TaxID=65393 RepID=B7KF90_GLOC7|nr:hypothetical protein [Gloeothece citriformis]ACK71806.1 conserved hypothetical protein [Gloeothece citriformis PCC 7424]
MFLQQKQSNELIEIIDLENLYDPCQKRVMGRSQAGQEMQDAQSYLKVELIFPSGETLPLCWIDPDYRLRERTEKELTYKG